MPESPVATPGNLRASSPDDPIKDDVLAAAAHQARERFYGQKGEQAARFLTRCFANVAGDDVRHLGRDQAYGAAIALWQFAARRQPGEIRLRLSNPRIEVHGWQCGHTVLETINDDMPFLVDSLTGALNRAGLTVHLVVHPVVWLVRNPDGDVEALYETRPDPAQVPEARAESLIHIQMDALSDPARLAALSTTLEEVLRQARAAVEDWRPMRAQVAGLAAATQAGQMPGAPAQRDEMLALLRWLDDDHFTYLGYREYRFTGSDAADTTALAVVPGSGLGILRDETAVVFQGLRHFAQLPPEAQHFLRQPQVLMVTKACRAQVHRTAHMDALFFKIFGTDAQGREQVIGQRVFVGLFTSTAYSQNPREIPVLRRKISRLLERSGFDLHSHDGKALLHILDNFPRDELVQADEDALFTTALGVLRLQERQRLALFVRHDPFGRFVSCLIYVPRDRYDTSLRRRFQAILEQAFAGHDASFTTLINESILARVHFIIQTTPGQMPLSDVAALENRLAEAARTWPDRLREALVDSFGEERGLRLAGCYGEAFPPAYTEQFSAEAAAMDIDRMETLRTAAPDTAQPAASRLAMNLYRPLEAENGTLRFKLYHRGAPVALSDVLPVLEHMDLRVITEEPFAIAPTGDHDEGAPSAAQTFWIHEFSLQTRTGLHHDGADFARLKDNFQDAFARIWAGDMEDDGFNRLVLRAGLVGPEVIILRAYARYLRQIGFPFSNSALEETLNAHPLATRLLLRLFRARLDPNFPGDREAESQALRAVLESTLETVQNLDEDRILRRYANLISATLRTNAFQPDPADPQGRAAHPYLAFKFLSHAVEGLPLPRPWVEIFVYSPTMEGIHLRGGRVARGGIRWSDRREDFRTEILGLMKAQMVKNAVIVPVGSKGGFVLKRPPPADAGSEARLAAGIAGYRTLIHGLLDLTDTLDADGQVIAPPHVVRHDADDPYLVVAADKGTATFSDIANQISLERRFWLGDAFASGGSHGYDHKKMGITARGAWESVKRHFRECGRDIQTTPFTVVGVGDMSGDVFGNGMLLSPHIQLLAAFDHRHIFCDPDPEPARALAERQRLFALPRSAWADYDPARISAGGGVFPRSAKQIPISAAMKARFDLAADHLTPAELAQALLRAPVDLLWFGGIGTFVKAASENHADVGDKANDALRINAEDLRAAVIGEGANLGMTQKARIVYASRGGRLNTDAIDNAAGVNTSDHEVNIKIVLNDVMARGDLTQKHRDALLAQMTDAVAALVLRDNYLQTLALTVAQTGGGQLVEQQARFLRSLEKQGRLDRVVENLPSDEELATRIHNRQPLTRPELAVLLAYAKIALFDDLLASDFPDAPALESELLAYFPAPLREQCADSITRHRLRREIIATTTANALVNRAGPTFVRDMVEKTGHGPGEIARAALVMRAIYRLDALWQDIEALDTRIPAAVQAAMLVETIRLLERGIAGMLATASQPLTIDQEIAAFQPGVIALAARIDEILGDEALAQRHEQATALEAQGVPPALAAHVAALPFLASAVDIARIAAATTCHPPPFDIPPPPASGPADAAATTRRLAAPFSIDAPTVAIIYFALGQRFGMDWLRDQAQNLKADNHWQKQAAAAIIDDLFALQSQLTRRVLDNHRHGPPDDALGAWLASCRPAVTRIEHLLAELRTVPAMDLSMLAVANRQLRALVI